MRTTEFDKRMAEQRERFDRDFEKAEQFHRIVRTVITYLIAPIVVFIICVCITALVFMYRYIFE